MLSQILRNLQSLSQFLLTADEEFNAREELRYHIISLGMYVPPHLNP
jgi:hypothetical protein